MSWKNAMPYTHWINWSMEQRAKFLKENNLEVRGYTLVGSDSHPSHVEFQPKEIKWKSIR